MLTDTVGEYSLLDALGVMEAVATMVLCDYNKSDEGQTNPKTGVYGSIYTVESAQYKVPLATVLFGDLVQELAIKYRHHCQEKACRLGDHIADGHRSSFQSADMKDTWPGAVLLDGYVLSCSGLPWDHDEVVGLVTGTELDLITIPQAVKIAAISQNDMFGRLARS